jgi:hypothetical protein
MAARFFLSTVKSKNERTWSPADNNEAHCSKLPGIKAELRRSQPAFEFRRSSPRHSCLWQTTGYSGEGE